MRRGQARERGTSRDESQVQGGDGGAEARGRCGGGDLEPAPARERGILLGQHRVCPVAERDDLQRPLSRLAVAVRGAVVELLPQPKGLGHRGARPCDHLPVFTRLFRPELRESETELIVGLPHGIIHLHQ